jgi:hypothetical protein
MLVHAAGWGLPFLCWLIAVLLIKKTGNGRIEYIKFIASFAIVCSTLPWVILSFLYGVGSVVPDDVTNFLTVNGFNGYACSAVFLAVTALSAAIIKRKVNFKAIKDTYFPGFKAGSSSKLKLLKPSLIIFAAVCMGLALYMIFLGGSTAKAVNLDLSTPDAGEVAIYKFSTVNNEAELKYELTDFNVSDFELKLKSENGEMVIISAKELWGNRISRSIKLTKGSYELFLRCRGGKGRLVIYEVK